MKITEDSEGIEVFEAPGGIKKGSYAYFEAAIEAGYYGCDDAETFSFKLKEMK